MQYITPGVLGRNVSLAICFSIHSAKSARESFGIIKWALRVCVRSLRSMTKPAGETPRSYTHYHVRAISVPGALIGPTLCPQCFTAAMQAAEGCKTLENVSEDFTD